MSQKLKTDTTEGFVGSVFKYSISTFANIGIMALSVILTGLIIPKGVFGQINLFLTTTNTIMTLAIVGLDQSLIRFYHKPPAGLKRNGLFRVCFYFSSAILLLGGTLCSTLLMRPLYTALNFNLIGAQVIPLVFLNALFYMVARYFNVLYRMEQNIKVYTTQSILMQFFFKLFYIIGFFFNPKAPFVPMMICSLLGLGGFALVFGFRRRHVLRPRRAEFSSASYKVVLPYGFAVAPTAVFVTLNALIPLTIVGKTLGNDLQGVYSFTYTLSSMVTLVQGGFASFWGPYMFQNYKTEQPRIKKVHNYLNFIILAFFCVLVAFEDVAFLIFRQHAAGQPVFPLMMLGAVFTILCETTVYGNAIARKPIFDTIGIGLSFLTNVVSCALLVPPYGLLGAAISIALSGFVMFLFRTFTAQRLYNSIPNLSKTILAIALALLVTVLGTALSFHFLLKLAVCLVAIGLYCLLYRSELLRLWKLAISVLQDLFKRVKT